MIKPALQGDRLLADVRAAEFDRMHLHLWWLGQSGYLVQWQGRHVLIDPYLSDALTEKYRETDRPHVRISERVVEPESLSFVDLVTSSHGHTDHLDAHTLLAVSRPLLAARATFCEADQRSMGELEYCLDDDQTVEVNGIGIQAVPAAHPTLERDDFGSLKCLGYVFHFDPYFVYHSGDTVVYEGMVERLKRFPSIDVALLPINGMLGNMNGRDAAQLAKSIGARLVIPCHYDMFEFNTADPYEQFVPECERIGQAYRVLKLGERFTYPAETSS